MELLLDGTRMSVDDAFSVGLVNKVFDADKLDEESLSYAKKLAKGATYAMSLIKQCVNKGLDEGFSGGLKMERDAFQDLIKSEDILLSLNSCYSIGCANSSLTDQQCSVAPAAIAGVTFLHFRRPLINLWRSPKCGRQK